MKDPEIIMYAWNRVRDPVKDWSCLDVSQEGF